jgi:hypothetical protein
MSGLARLANGIPVAIITGAIMLTASSARFYYQSATDSGEREKGFDKCEFHPPLSSTKRFGHDWLNNAWVTLTTAL